MVLRINPIFLQSRPRYQEIESPAMCRVFLAGIRPFNGVLPRYQVTPEVEKEIRDLRRHGPMTIEKLTGVHFSVVMDVLRKYGYY